jgi:glycosyltransferase involved in cell wall biosynthesis
VPSDDPLRLAFLGDPNSIHTRRWVSWFAEEGHEVHLLEGFGGAIAPGLDERIRIERFRGRRELRRVLGRIRPDVLHGHFVRRYGWQAASAGFHPYVISPWGSDLLRVPRHAWRTRWWNRRALRGADLVTVTSEHMRAAALDAGARRPRIEIVQHGVDTRRFSSGPPPAELAERLGVANRAVIFSPRTVRPLYRHETIVDAFASLPDEPILVMTRGGADPAYLANLLERMRGRGVADRVRIVDAIAHEQMPAYLRLARVVVSVPESDSFPVTVLEAMACATPVVVSDLPPARAALGLIAPELIVPLGDPPALATALRRALALSEAERRSLGEALRGYVVQAADYATNMARMEVLYRRLARRA